MLTTISRGLYAGSELCVYKHKYNQSKIQLKLRKIRFACKIWHKKKITTTRDGEGGRKRYERGHWGVGDAADADGDRDEARKT